MKNFTPELIIERRIEKIKFGKKENQGFDERKKKKKMFLHSYSLLSN